MPISDIDTKISRRGALALGGGAVAGGVLATPAGALAKTAGFSLRRQHGTLPVKQIEKIVQAQGTVSGGILNVGLSRSDLTSTGPLGVTQDGDFQLSGNLTFQPLGDHYAFLNCDLALTPTETQPFLDAIFANGLTIEAFHQHYIELDPQVWFMHWRGFGGPLKLATAAHNVVKATATPLPQTMPVNPTTPLDSKRLGRILGGAASVGGGGVVTVEVTRPAVRIQESIINSGANLATDIEIKPLNASGSMAAVAPDFSLTGPQVDPVLKLMKSKGWFIGCLYNQETQEDPQLYFSHMIKTGDPYALAAEVRAGLNLTNSSKA